jgi:hypothetical protein
MSSNNHPTYFTKRANCRVNNLVYSSEVDVTGATRTEIGILPAAAANSIMNAVDIAAIVTKGGTLVAAYAANPQSVMGLYGRNVTVTLSGAGTPTVTVRGRDYLGQPVAENIVGTGASAALGKKAFVWIDSITTSAGVAATTLNLGTGNVLGIPYALMKVDAEIVDNAVAAAGTVVLATTTAQTATSNDPRGSYTPAAGAIPNGARDIVLLGQVLNGQLHGVPHYYA